MRQDQKIRDIENYKRQWVNEKELEEKIQINSKLLKKIRSEKNIMNWFWDSVTLSMNRN